VLSPLTTGEICNLNHLKRVQANANLGSTYLLNIFEMKAFFFSFVVRYIQIKTGVNECAFFTIQSFEVDLSYVARVSDVKTPLLLKRFLCQGASGNQEINKEVYYQQIKKFTTNK
jgi:hypothetical protein